MKAKILISTVAGDLAGNKTRSLNLFQSFFCGVSNCRSFPWWGDGRWSFIIPSSLFEAMSYGEKAICYANQREHNWWMVWNKKLQRVQMTQNWRMYRKWNILERFSSPSTEGVRRTYCSIADDYACIFHSKELMTMVRLLLYTYLMVTVHWRTKHGGLHLSETPPKSSK